MYQEMQFSSDKKLVNRTLHTEWNQKPHQQTREFHDQTKVCFLFFILFVSQSVSFQYDDKRQVNGDCNPVVGPSLGCIILENVEERKEMQY